MVKKRWILNWNCGFFKFLFYVLYVKLKLGGSSIFRYNKNWQKCRILTTKNDKNDKILHNLHHHWNLKNQSTQNLIQQPTKKQRNFSETKSDKLAYHIQTIPNLSRPTNIGQINLRSGFENTHSLQLSITDTKWASAFFC
jgi:hypothetical protein